MYEKQVEVLQLIREKEEPQAWQGQHPCFHSITCHLTKEVLTSPVRLKGKDQLRVRPFSVPFLCFPPKTRPVS